MIKKLLFFLLVAWSVNTCAQTIKTDVLVIGGGPDGVAAAVQCARSKVKTVLAADKIGLPDYTPGQTTFTVQTNLDVPSGIWGEFLSQFKSFSIGVNGAEQTHQLPIHFEKSFADSILTKMADTTKNLTVELNTSFTSVKKDGDRWEVHLLRDGKDLEIKARVVIDATEKASVAENAGAKFNKSYAPRLIPVGEPLYRTDIAVGGKWPGDTRDQRVAIAYQYWGFPVDAVIAHGGDNLLVTEGLLPRNKNSEFLPVQIELGQGVGAIAAYCAFFKTTTANLKVRTIQGELLDFKAYLSPITDIKQNDPGWRAIQQVCATGLLRGDLKEEGGNDYFFMPDEPVITTDIEPVLKAIYTRAFLWFNREKPGDKFTVGNTLSFISDHTLTEPALLKATIQRNWQTQFKFKPDFDLNRPITRREFAVLANKYLNPFARTVDLNGRFVN